MIGGRRFTQFEDQQLESSEELALRHLPVDGGERYSNSNGGSSNMAMAWDFWQQGLPAPRLAIVR